MWRHPSQGRASTVGRRDDHKGYNEARLAAPGPYTSGARLYDGDRSLKSGINAFGPCTVLKQLKSAPPRSSCSGRRAPAVRPPRGPSAGALAAVVIIEVVGRTSPFQKFEDARSPASAPAAGEQGAPGRGFREAPGGGRGVLPEGGCQICLADVPGGDGAFFTISSRASSTQISSF